MGSRIADSLLFKEKRVVIKDQVICLNAFFVFAWTISRLRFTAYYTFLNTEIGSTGSDL